VWLGQGLLTVVSLWGTSGLADRIRTGDVVIDLYRPWDLQAALFADDVGRAGYIALIRSLPPVLLCMAFFPFQWPTPYAAVLFVISVALALIISFALRFLIDSTAFWLLDGRGVHIIYATVTPLLSGLAVPLSLMPEWAQIAIWSMPFAAMLQAPINIFLGHGSIWLLIAYQILWAAVLLAAGRLVLTRIVRRVVIQGG
jgi:ABC-2 type transport system permease protein